GAADAGAAQVAFVGRLLEPGGIGRLVRQLEGVERHRASALEGEERVPLPGIAARLGRGRDQRARRLLVLRLEVLADDAVLLDRVAGEGIAPARVLSGHAAAGEIVL